METTETKTFHILLIDDDEDDFLIIRSLLAGIPQARFKLDWASSFKEGEAIISTHKHDLYLIDYRLGAENGLELLALAQASKRTEPFIILTGAGDEKIEQLALKEGASDYLIKGTFDHELLSRTLRYALQRKHMEEQRIQHLIEITKAKDEFISLASHQLRTPATAVKQYVGMVLQGFVGEVPEAQRTMLETAYQSNERQLQIVSDLLRVAKVDAGHVKLNKTDTNLCELIPATIQDLSGKFADQEQTVTFKKPAEPIIVSVDAPILRMVIENILDNASKYSPKGTAMSVILKQTKDAVHISMSDHGVGISEHDMTKLFVKFSRIDNILSAEVGGTGLGLYWAKKIVDLHRGDIIVKSEEGKGSTFTVTLPRL
jgi:two-component system sensor histidine kinase/response regulator